ncbi:leucine--tRNA ligase [Croceiramulus getboli]|nr:class I tRNA ligase family protein [Flavobacteriaceae bacterium YJPT1-3]
MQYDHQAIEKKWQRTWKEQGTFEASNSSDKPKYYVLDMFPYPSGAGLHVGHPLGYIASDIYARYKRHQGHNVLHPMGYDSFGLPAEQYAIQTGQHPAITTQENIARYREQLDRIGFSFDWSREVRTSDPDYYRWTQWIFIQLFESWYNHKSDKAEPIETLIAHFEKQGTAHLEASHDEDAPDFTAEEWKQFSSDEQQRQLLKYRLTYLAESEVNWCPELGTVLANDEIINGVSERGGYPVVRKKMTQWSMRITAYAQRLLDGLDGIDWPQPLKDSQTYWIGRSEGALVHFNVYQSGNQKLSDHQISAFTTRPDTIFGVSFMTLAPEHELVTQITTPEQRQEVEAYVAASAKRSERDRMADVKTITGAFTGAYAQHPFTKEPIPIWIGDYVLAGYGTGAVMSVPCGDQRDYDFAKHFDIAIPNVFEDVDISEEAFADKEKTIITNSDFLNGLPYAEALTTAIAALEEIGRGQGKVNYRLRDAVFSRQRYWGEPFPVYYINGLPQMIEAKHLPLRLPEVEKYLPTEEGEPPLGRAEVWAWDSNKNSVVSKELIDESKGVYPLELNTMPGWAGSSWYFFRYMEKVLRDEVFASAKAMQYWENVDLYIGGSEHATGHLLYSRFWVKFLYDRKLVPVEEPFKKLINQGMILGQSAFVYRLREVPGFEGQGEEFIDAVKNHPIIISAALKEKLENGHIEIKDFSKDLLSILKGVFGSKIVKASVHTDKIQPLHVDVNLVNASDQLDVMRFANRFSDFEEAVFIGDSGRRIIEGSDEIFTVGREVEKMSKSKYNVVNPDQICEEYGADTLRMYEMFLGPLEQAKPWNTAGITGVYSFLKKFWRLYHSGDSGSFQVTEDSASKESLKTLHKTIKKVQEDIESFSFNTSVSTFMIAVNELSSQKCTTREVLEPLVVLLSPYAPHIAEELWALLGHKESVSQTPFPKFEEKHLIESTKEYPISFNGKMKFLKELSLDLSKEEIEAAVLADERTQQQLDGRTPKKVIVVPGKIVNLVG